MQYKAEIVGQLKKLGVGIRRARMARDMTQAKLAEVVDLNIRTVQKIEAGHINMLVTTAMRIQKALNCPWEKLLS